MLSFEQEIDRRRTFAIISHPDAGKTTITEKLLFNGGAIHRAGEVNVEHERHAARLAEPAKGEADAVCFNVLRRCVLMGMAGHGGTPVS